MTVYKRSFWRAFWATERWADRRSMIASVAWYAPKYRLGNRLMDARSILAGACNASTWTGQKPYGYAGGYSHWRCSRKRRHLGPHRFENYVFAGLRVEYKPIEPYTAMKEICPFWKLARGRHPIDSRRRSRLRARWAEEAMEERRAARLSA
jgi:hypothetical protein